MGIFSDYAQRIYEHNLAVMPVNGKKAILSEWQKLSLSLPTQEQIDVWTSKYPDLNIGIVCGKASGIIGFDIDTDDEVILEIIHDVLPASPVGKRGQKGATYFYKYSGQVSRQIKYKGMQVIDVLSDSRQTVIPPSGHPVTQQPYQWIDGRSLYDFLDDLPELSETQIKLIASALGEISSSFDPSLSNGAVSRGRNDALKSYVCALSDSKSIEEMVQLVILRDQRLFGERSLFSDKSEYPTGDSYVNAFEFVTNIKKTIIKKKVGRNEPTGLEGEERFVAGGDGYYRAVTYIDDKGQARTTYVPEYLAFAEDVKREFNYIFDDAGYFHYVDGRWISIGDSHLSNLIYEKNKRRLKPAHVDPFRKMIKAVCFKGAFSFLDTLGKINLANGIYDLNSGVISEHSSSYFFKNKIPISYLPNARCDEWLRFLAFVFEGDAELIAVSQKIFGYCLIGGDPFLHKAFVLYGSGRNGKSTFLNVLKQIIGHGNYSSVSLAKIDREFSAVMLDGSMANILEETPTDKINSEVFKAAVGGGEIIVARKGFDEYATKINARFVFACNEMPIFKDNSDGLIERLYFLPFERFIEADERDRTIDGRLVAELPGILKWAIDGAQVFLKDKDYRLPITKASMKLLDVYQEESDYVYTWCVDHIEYDVRGKVSSQSLYEFYRTDCEREGQHILSKKVFIKKLMSSLKRRFRNPQDVKNLEKIKTDRFYIGQVQQRGILCINYNA